MAASCGQGISPTTSQDDGRNAVHFGAAFTELSQADIYNQQRAVVATADSSNGMQVDLPNGQYLVDFVDIKGQHSFAPDGRLTFAPGVEGASVVDGPVTTPLTGYPTWKVQVGASIQEHALAMQPMNTYPTCSSPADCRSRVIWEASFAMKGNYSIGCTSSESCWYGNATGYHADDYFALATNGLSGPSGTYYSYLDYDPAAWNLEKSNYGYTGNVCCRDPGYTGQACGVPTYDSHATVTQYTCQANSCTTATHPRGGECKGFQNLMLYRSGAFQTTAHGWLNTPSDAYMSANLSKYPLETTSNIQVGDPLRSINGHSTLVVYADNIFLGIYRLVDSNFVDNRSGYADEYIGSHLSTFTSSGGSYRSLACVYVAAWGDYRCQ
jgi:hypothetical protein